MNLMKAYALTIEQQPCFDRAHHGLSECLREPCNELDNAYLQAYKSPNPRTGALNLFDELLKALSGVGLTKERELNLPTLLPQVVPGHRLWVEATGESERFVAIHDIRFTQNAATKEIWLTLDLFADDLTRLGITHSRLLNETRLVGKFREVETAAKVNGRKLIRLEQTQVRSYTHRPSDKVPSLVEDIKSFLWATVASVAPYRRYYLYLAPTSEHEQILPQLMSIYAITFYLGSITRYRPHNFDQILSGPLGPRIEEFIGGQPLQFIYLMASEFAERDVTRPSIV